MAKKRQALPLPLLKRQIKRVSAAALSKCPRPLFLLLSARWKGARPLACSQQGLLYSALEEQESSGNNKVASGRHGGAFRPGLVTVCSQPWCGVEGDIFCVRCLMSYRRSASELSTPWLACLFFFSLKRESPVPTHRCSVSVVAVPLHQSLSFGSQGLSCVYPDTLQLTSWTGTVPGWAGGLIVGGGAAGFCPAPLSKPTPDQKPAAFRDTCVPRLGHVPFWCTCSCCILGVWAIGG